MAIATILGILVTPITEIAKQLCPPLKTQVEYLVKYHSNTKLLRTETEELRKMVESTSCAIVEARCRGKAVTNEIESWLREVEKTIFNVQKLQEEDTVICCTNLRKIYVKGKRTVKLLKVVKKLKGQVQNVPISKLALPPSIDVMPSGDFEVFASTRVAMERIIVAFGGDDNKVIGVYGMRGVGKTSIIKEVAKHSKMVMNMFDDVAIASVSSNPVSKIQRDIAECLGMHLEDKSEYVRSLRLAERLKLGRRTLIIFDDVWERVDFSQLGIPSWNDGSNCKIAITTRNRDVCSEMDCNISIEVKPLSVEDSWSLFKKASGDVVESVDLKLLAEEIVGECGGLPIALVTIGRVLRNKEPRFWEDAVYELRQSKPLNQTRSFTNLSSVEKKIDKERKSEREMRLTSNTTSSSIQIMRWSSPIPYLFDGLALMFALISISLVILARSFRKNHQPSSDQNDTEKGTATRSKAVKDLPEIVVIMAGDDTPTHIAMPSNFSSSSHVGALDSLPLAEKPEVVK